MDNGTLRFSLGSALVILGGVLIYRSAAAVNRSLVRQTRRQVRVVRNQAVDIMGAAREAAAEKLLEVVDAGQSVFQRAGRRVAERIAG